MIETDDALVRRSRRGDRAAFEELVHRCARFVYARVYLETGDPHRAEDLVQETLLRAWKRISDLDDPARFRPWLSSIAQRVVIDAMRRDARRKRDTMRIVKDDIGQLADRSPPPDQQSETNEQRERALSILRGMPEEYRVPLMLRYFAGADYDTISRQLALSNGSLRGLLQRGMMMLRDEMKRTE